MAQLDVAGWTLLVAVLTLIAAVGAVVVPIYQRWDSRQRKATVWITEHESRLGPIPEIGVAIRNDGEADIVVNHPAHIIIPGHPGGEPIKFHNLQFGRSGIGPNAFPLRLQSGDELTTFFFRNKLADDLWMRNCKPICRFHGAYFPTKGNGFYSKVFDAPVDEWLPADASARTLKP